MKKFAIVVGLTIILAGAAAATAPELMQVGTPGGVPYTSPDRDVQFWIDTPDPAGQIGSSEIIPAYQLESMIANDFIVETDLTLCTVRWWGGYWNGFTVPIASGWKLQFFRDSGCTPGTMLLELILTGNAGETNALGNPNTFVYEHTNLNLALAPDLYWFAVNMGPHNFPPQWGRVAATMVQVCDSVFKSAFFSYPNWTPAYVVFGVPYDASQEFLRCEGPVDAETTSWGAIKGLYR